MALGDYLSSFFVGISEGLLRKLQVIRRMAQLTTRLISVTFLLLLNPRLSFAEHAKREFQESLSPQNKYELYEVNERDWNEEGRAKISPLDLRWFCKDGKVEEVRKFSQSAPNQTPPEKKAEKTTELKNQIIDLVVEGERDTVTRELDNLLRTHTLDDPEFKKWILILQLKHCLESQSPICYYYAENVQHHLTEQRKSLSDKQYCLLAQAYQGIDNIKSQTFQQLCNKNKQPQELTDTSSQKQSPVDHLLTLALSKNKKNNNHFSRLFLSMPNEVKGEVRKNIKQIFQIELNDCEILRLASHSNNQLNKDNFNSIATNLALRGVIPAIHVATTKMTPEQQEHLALRLDNSQEARDITQDFEDFVKQKHQRIQNLMAQLPPATSTNISLHDQAKASRLLEVDTKNLTTADVLQKLNSRDWECSPKLDSARNQAKKLLTSYPKLKEEWDSQLSIIHEKNLKQQAQNAIRQFQNNQIEQLDLVLILDDLSSQTLSSPNLIRELTLEFAPKELKNAIATAYRNEFKSHELSPLATSNNKKHNQLFHQLFLQLPLETLEKHLPPTRTCLMNLYTPTNEDEVAYSALALETTELGPAFISMLNRSEYKEHSGLRRKLAEAIVKTGPHGVKELPVLLSLLKRDKDLYVRGAAAEAIGKIGPQASKALPNLLGALNTGDDYDFRHKVVKATVNLGPEAVSRALHTLIKQLEYASDEKKRLKALYGLRHFEYLAKDFQVKEEVINALPTLIKVLENDKDFEVRTEIIHEIGRLGPQAINNALPTLIKVLENDKDPEVSKRAAFISSRLGPQAIKALPTLIKVLENDKDPGARRRAAYFISGLGPQAIEALPTLIKVLGNEIDSTARTEMIRAINKISTKSD